MRYTHLELVGIQVTRCKPARTYTIENIYAVRDGKDYSDIATMRSYDMTLTEKFDRKLSCLMACYETVLKNVWKQEDKVSESYYLQFVVLFRPEKVGLDGDWEHWVEW